MRQSTRLSLDCKILLNPQLLNFTLHAARRSRTQSGAHPTYGAMADRITNILCTVIVAAAFAMIGIDYSTQRTPTHSGTQPYVRH